MARIVRHGQNPGAGRVRLGPTRFALLKLKFGSRASDFGIRLCAGLTAHVGPGIPRVMAEPRKIALFGGTFDPVHCGHISLAKIAKEKLELDEVRFVPCRISPHKQNQQPTPAEDRLEMLRLTTADLPWALVDDLEIGREGPSYSWHTAEAMAARFPAARLFWIMGGDQWRALPTWAHPDRLAACVEFIVFARDGKPEPHEGFRMHALEGVHPASATMIREAIAHRGAEHPWLHPAVSRWIRDRQLYQAIQ